MRSGNIDDFGMDTITLAGPAGGQAGGHARGRLHAGDADGARHRRPPRRHGRRGAGGARQRPARHRLPGAARLRRPVAATCTTTRWTSPRRMLEMCAALGVPRAAGLLVDQPRTPAATSMRMARDLRKLAMLALPLGIKVAYEGLSWGRTVNEFTTAWDVVLPRRLRQPRPGHRFVPRRLPPRPRWTTWTLLDPRQDLPGAAGRLHVAGDPHGRGAHRPPRAPSACSPARACTASSWPSWCCALDAHGLPRRLQLRGLQRRLPADAAAHGGRARAPRRPLWLAEDVLRRSVPLPNQMRLRQRAG